MTGLIPNFRTVYDNLSEYCHPNYAGTFRSFAKIDKEAFTVDFKDEATKERAVNVALPALFGSYGTFEYWYNALGDQTEALNEFFED